MKIRVLAASAVLAAALAVPAIPAVADEGSAASPVSTSPAVTEDLGWGSVGTDGPPPPIPATLSNDLGWG